MARAGYLGIGDKARKVKKIYLGIGDKARKVKKVYVGDANGKARLCWSANVDLYIGTFDASQVSEVTISDIPFKPKGIMIVHIDDVEGIQSASSLGDWTWIESLYSYGGKTGAKAYTEGTITFTDNSVVLKTNSTDVIFRSDYRYVIWG